jgi:phosphate ABC transporter phosphate-binding protein
MKLIRILVAAAVACLLTFPASGRASATGAHAQIQGDGSSWAYNAINQWVTDVAQQNLQVVYTSVGSAQGRADFANSTVDWADSDIGYQTRDPVTGQPDISKRPYAYVPLVAGGTAFPYQIKVAGQQVKNLRLSGPTLAKIFTLQITNWNDPAITADNNGHALPSLPIIPVVHSEGAGSTAQFTKYLAQEYPSIWSSFAGYSSYTEYYPQKGSIVATNGSDSVMNTVASAAGNGSIGYDEYSYALAAGFPVVKVENSAGYFTAPTQYNVAVALTQAQINTDKTSPNYLLQDLTNVYTYSDPRTYPLSSYSYGIIPTSSTDSGMTTAKRQTIADFLAYATCQGQAEMGPIGYSPLPINLVEASFQQVGLLKQADPNVSLDLAQVTACHNPTFVAGNPNLNYLAQIAPQPPSCDKAGQGPCSATAGIVLGNPTANGKAPTSSASAGTSTGSSSSGSRGAAASSGSTASGGAGSSGSSSGGSAVGTSGASTAAATSSGGTNGTGSSSGLSDAASDQSASELAATANPAVIPGNGSGSSGLLAAFAGVLLLLAIAIPPLGAQLKDRRRDRGEPG